MEKLYYRIFAYAVFFSMLILYCDAQWLADVRLTSDTAYSYTSRNNSWCIASYDNYVHTVWYDFRNGNYEIYYKRSITGGVGWGSETRLTNSNALSMSPSIAISDLFVHVVWYDYRDGNNEIYYKRSTDRGETWGADTRLTNNASFSIYPSIARASSLLHVVWSDDRNGGYEIYYKRSITGGSSWEADTRLTNFTGESNYPSVAASDLNIHVVWYDVRDGNFEIYYKRSTDGGYSWGADTRLTNNTAYSEVPSISVSGQTVHVVWSDYRDGNYEIYYKRSTNGGLSWGGDKRITNNSASSMYPSVTSSGTAVHVAWYDTRDGNDEIYYISSTDDGSSWSIDTRLTNNSSYSWNPSVAVSGNAVHVLWQDRRDGNYEIYYKRNPTGNPFGIIRINNSVPDEFSLGQNYPNPFNPTTKIRFEIPPARDTYMRNIQLKIFDNLGKEIAVLVSGQLQPGIYEAEWNPGVSGQAVISSGVYYYRLSAEDFISVKKMILLK